MIKGFIHIFHWIHTIEKCLSIHQQRLSACMLNVFHVLFLYQIIVTLKSKGLPLDVLCRFFAMPTHFSDIVRLGFN